MNKLTPLEILKKVDFGNPDAIYDNKIEAFFLDRDYWANILDSNKFFVIGRKGCGKSAIYSWLYKCQSSKGIFVSNLSFAQFPFEKFLQLSDDHFSKPNQYQSIWKNIILSSFAQLIVSRDNRCSDLSEIYSELKNYVKFKFGDDLRDLHAKITTQTSKKGINLTIQGVGPYSDFENVKHVENSYENITDVNNRLESLVISYLSVEKQIFVVQFDELDDNYNMYTEKLGLFQALISLFKVIKHLNLTLNSNGSKSKAIAYLRSDIYAKFMGYDADSAKFDNYKYDLNWVIKNKNDWEDADLFRMIERRISTSVDIGDIDSKIWNYVFENDDIWLKNSDGSEIRRSAKRYISFRSFQRPRDILQFCIEIQKQAIKTNRLNTLTFKDAEKDYYKWFLNQLTNELAPIIANYELLYRLLKRLGRKPFEYSTFIDEYEKINGFNIFGDDITLLNLLYEFGIINNTWRIGDRDYISSSIVMEGQKFDESKKIAINTAVGGALLQI